MSVRAGEVADGETMTTPFGTATLLAMAMVTPEQSAPTMAAMLSTVIRRSAAACPPAALSMQVESARTRHQRCTVEQQAALVDFREGQLGGIRHAGGDPTRSGL